MAVADAEIWHHGWISGFCNGIHARQCQKLSTRERVCAIGRHRGAAELVVGESYASGCSKAAASQGEDIGVNPPLAKSNVVLIAIAVEAEVVRQVDRVEIDMRTKHRVEAYRRSNACTLCTTLQKYLLRLSAANEDLAHCYPQIDCLFHGPLPRRVPCRGRIDLSGWVRPRNALDVSLAQRSPVVFAIYRIANNPTGCGIATAVCRALTRSNP